MLTGTLVFGSFRLDSAAGQLFAGERSVPLRRRTWDVLCHLLSRPGELVSKAELLATVWRDAAVSEQTLSTSIAELRRALGDDPRSPRFIETVHRRGFRFIARVSPASRPETVESPLGRAGEMGTLLRWWSEAQRGHRRIGFVMGDVGMGKTRLARAFADRVCGEHVRIATGSCIEHHAEGEAFMPVIDAIRHLCRGVGGDRVARRVRAGAPPWLVDLLVATAQTRPPGGAEQPKTRAETLRCLAETIEALASDSPLVLILEDVHWSDGSTVDLLNLMGRRTEAARLLVLATLRPAEALASGHPVMDVMQSLSPGGGCGVVELEGLAAREAALLLARWLGGGTVPPELAAAMVQRTGGNPFFLRELAEHLASSGELVRTSGSWRVRDPAPSTALPDSVLAAIEPRIARLEGSEQRVLEAGALVGARFSPAVVAEALAGGLDEEGVDDACSRLAARGEMVTHGDEGTYQFLHALNAAALRRRIPAGRRRRLHERIAEALEREGRASAAALANHFARAGCPGRAVDYYEQAVRIAKQRFADREAAFLCSAALERLAALPADRQRSERELRLQLELGAATLATRGYSAPEQAATFGRVYELADSLDQPSVRFVGAGGLFFHHLSSGNVPAGLAQAERMLELSLGLPTAMGDAARTGMGVALYNAGRLVEALGFLERESPEPAGPEISQVDLAVFRLAALADTQAHLGRLDRARTTIEACTAKGACSGRPFDLANGHRMAAELYAILGDVKLVRSHAREAIALSDQHGFVQLLAIGHLFEGWALAQDGEATRGLAEIVAALAALEPTGYRLTHSAFRLRQAEAALWAGEPDAAERAVEAGLAYTHASGEHRHVSDLLRLQGESRIRRAETGAEEAAEASFLAACRVAREQGALLLELRALMGLAGLARGGDAASVLRERLRDFPESLPPGELEAARRLAA